MPARRDWDFHKYIQNVISFLPHNHHSAIHTEVSASLFYFAPVCGNGSSRRISNGRDRQRAECCAGSGGCSLQSPQSKPERSGADKDVERLEGLCNEQESPWRPVLMHTGIYGQRCCREGLVDHTACRLALLLFAVD